MSQEFSAHGPLPHGRGSETNAIRQNRDREGVPSNESRERNAIRQSRDRQGAVRATARQLILTLAAAATLQAEPVWVAVAFAPQATTGAGQLQLAPGIAVPIPVGTTGAVPVGAGAPAVEAPATAGGGGGGGGPMPSVGSPSSAIGRPSEVCKVTLLAPMLAAGATGGPVDLKVTFAPPTCRRDAGFDAAWLRRDTAGEPGTFRFLVEPNPTPQQRQARIVIGDQTVTLVQAPGRPPRFAVAPARVDFALKKSKPAEMPAPITIAAWSDAATLTYSAVADAGSRAWAEVIALGDPKVGSGKFQVRVKPDALAPGTHSGTILVSTSGAPAVAIPVRVVVEP